eukprot:PhM_4_TR5895/c0_g4_i11/m.67463
MAEIQRLQDTHIKRALMAAVTPAHLFSTAVFARLAKGESEKHANVRMTMLPWEKTAKPTTSATTTSPSPAPKPQPKSKKYFVTTTPAQGVEDSNLSSSYSTVVWGVERTLHGDTLKVARCICFAGLSCFLLVVFLRRSEETNPPYDLAANGVDVLVDGELFFLVEASASRASISLVGSRDIMLLDKLCQ